MELVFPNKWVFVVVVTYLFIRVMANWINYKFFFSYKLTTNLLLQLPTYKILLFDCCDQSLKTVNVQEVNYKLKSDLNLENKAFKFQVHEHGEKK